MFKDTFSNPPATITKTLPPLTPAAAEANI